jgi:hypothetical protein
MCVLSEVGFACILTLSAASTVWVAVHCDTATTQVPPLRAAFCRQKVSTSICCSTVALDKEGKLPPIRCARQTGHAAASAPAPCREATPATAPPPAYPPCFPPPPVVTFDYSLHLTTGGASPGQPCQPAAMLHPGRELPANSKPASGASLLSSGGAGGGRVGAGKQANRPCFALLLSRSWLHSHVAGFVAHHHMVAGVVAHQSATSHKDIFTLCRASHRPARPSTGNDSCQGVRPRTYRVRSTAKPAGR